MNRVLLAAAALAAPAAARGDDDPTHRHPSTAVHTMERAGYPQLVRKHAQPAESPHFTGGYVGGGRLTTSKHADGRVTPTDGTWGWDYVGFGRRPGRVFLDWYHDRPKQPKPGPYKTDGPHVPDPIAAHPVQKVYEALTGKGGEGGEGH